MTPTNLPVSDQPATLTKCLLESDRLSTLPRHLEPLRDRLVREAQANLTFLAEQVFTREADGIPTDDEILQCIECRLWTLTHEYPEWWMADSVSYAATANDGAKPNRKKTAATPAQLAGLAKGRETRKQARAESEARVARRIAELRRTDS